MSRFRSWWVVALSLPLVLTLGLAACGGDDDDDGGDSKDSGSSVNVATGSDEQYVADICKAAKKFSDDLDKVMKDVASVKDPNELTKKFVGPFEDFSNAFSKAKPPKDLKDWHADSAKKFKEIVAQLKKGDPESMASALGEDPIGEPPAGAAERLQKAAEKNKDCQAAEFDFSG